MEEESSMPSMDRHWKSWELANGVLANKIIPELTAHITSSIYEKMSNTSGFHNPFSSRKKCSVPAQTTAASMAPRPLPPAEDESVENWPALPTRPP